MNVKTVLFNDVSGFILKDEVYNFAHFENMMAYTASFQISNWQIA